MGRAIGLISVILVVAAGGYIYTRQAQSVTASGETPRTTVDVVGVRNDLMSIANAEKRYWVMNSKYASLDELRSGGDIEVPSRQDYTYSVEANDSGFKIIASYSGSDPKAPRHISVNDRMTMSSE
jgi:hypothetical protein